MFPRFLFLLLLALNVGAASWIAFAPNAASAPEPVIASGVQRLVLLSERDEAGRGDAASTAQASANSADDLCVSIGPFATQADMRSAMKSISPSTRRAQFRNARSTQSRGYWVYLPAVKSREEALGVARSLSSKGVRDYYVVTAGEQQNTVSLGLFREQANAERRRAEITALGFAPQLTQRTEELPVYWIDYATAREQPLDWRAKLTGTDLREQPIDCF